MRTLHHEFELLKLTLPFPLSKRYGLLCDLLGKALLELEESPFLGQRLVVPIQAYQEQVG
jgi:hypothetical protein